MKIALTGATGLIGHSLAGHLLAAGHRVTALGRQPAAHPDALHLPYALGEAPRLEGHDALIHAAFRHVPGRYRGGEGDDPEGFRAANLDGSERLFQAAAEAGVGRILFLSSRAVYGAYPAGTLLAETLEPRPDTLYGRIKLEAEEALSRLAGPSLAAASLRVTGVYGAQAPGRPHKWRELFAQFARGEAVAPSIGTEVHFADLAAAAELLLAAAPAELAPQRFNVSDFILDRRDLLAAFAEATGIKGQLPPRSDPATVSAMTSDRLARLGWRPRGAAALGATLRHFTGP